MIFTKTKIKGINIIEPEPKIDNRGYFERIYCANEFKENGINFKIVQSNKVLSLKKGIIRGPHMQRSSKSEEKLIQCVKGSIFDVAIDFRKKSPTFGQWIGNILSSKNMKMIYMPKGIMHGYQALENNTIVEYSVSQYYSPKDVIGVRWDDTFFNIPWPIKNTITSDIDANWPLFNL